MLAEVPEQVTSYMKSRGIAPKQPPPVSDHPTDGHSGLYPEANGIGQEDVALDYSGSVKSSAPPLADVDY